MDVERRRLVWGPEESARRWLTFVGGYAVVVAAGTAYRLLSPPAFAAPVLYEDPLITALLLGPSVVAAVGGGLALGLAVGAAAALAYGAVLLGAALLSTGGAAGLAELVSVVVASAVVAGVAGVLGAAVGHAVRR